MKRMITLALFAIVALNSYSQQIGDGWAPVITDFGAILQSGVYNGLNASGRVPDDSYSGWQHLFVIRHPNSNNNHQFQLGTAFTENDRLFFRKIATGLEARSPQWFELATRGTNTFSGNQTIQGNFAISKPNGTSMNFGFTDLPNSTVCDITTNGITAVRFMSPDFSEGLHILAGGYSFGYSDAEVSMGGSLGGDGFRLGKNDFTNVIISVDGNATFNGKVTAKEIEIKYNVWADYVFDHGYNLMPLNKLGSFISQYKHLPNIPSTAEVKEKNVNVGEMQVKLLEKVEELTLYILEQEKRIKSLEAQVESNAKK